MNLARPYDELNVDKLPKAVAFLDTNQSAAVFWRLQFLNKLIPRMRQRFKPLGIVAIFPVPKVCLHLPENPES